MNTARYVVGVVLLVATPPGVLLWFVIHPFVGFWRRLGPVWTYVVLSVPVIAMMLGLYLARDTLLGADLGTSVPLIVLAVACLVPGMLIARKRRRYLTKKILSGVPELRRDAGNRGTLLTEGIYGKVRHPRYIEFLCWVGSYAFFANHAGLYVMLVLMLPTLYMIVLLEERELRDRFGEEYEEYRRRVPRFVPRRVSGAAS
jgi:protein-S-isoprenylcysteine O-methyltransferase Ste14